MHRSTNGHKPYNRFNLILPQGKFNRTHGNVCGYGQVYRSINCKQSDQQEKIHLHVKRNILLFIMIPIYTMLNTSTGSVPVVLTSVSRHSSPPTKTMKTVYFIQNNI